MAKSTTTSSKPRRPKPKPAPRVVYGAAFWDGDAMLVLSCDEAYDAASYYLARNEARTWGEFLASLPSHHREYLLSRLRERIDYPGFEEYWEKRVLDPEELGYDPEEESPTREQAWAEYLDLSCISERLPLGDEPFDASEWEAEELENGYAPADPQSQMVDDVPFSILQQYGEVGESMWDGSMATLRMEDESEIVALYRKRGYRIVRHDRLMDAACGFTGNPDELHATLVLENIFAGIPEPRPEEIEPEPTRLPPAPPPAPPAPPAPLAPPITEIAVDPWLKDARNCGPVPPRAALLCGYLVDVSGFGVSESAYLHRTDAGEELWVRNDHKVGRMAVAPPQPSERDAALLLFDVLIRARVSFSWPHDFTTPGLMTELHYRAVIDTVDAELTRHAEQARVSGDQSAIVVAARELGLSPEPSGEGPHHWRANCPGTQHSLMISSGNDKFGCGYCKVNGGVEELRKLVELRRRR